MKTMVASALLALPIMGGIATAASAGEGDEFGTRTPPRQQPSLLLTPSQDTDNRTARLNAGPLAFTPRIRSQIAWPPW